MKAQPTKPLYERIAEKAEMVQARRLAVTTSIVEQALAKMPSDFSNTEAAYREGVLDAQSGKLTFGRRTKLDFDAYSYGAATYNALAL